MAKHFSQKDIDEFKECFYFHVKKGVVSHEDELSLIMRSLGYSPTCHEITAYFNKYKAAGDGNRIEFATFLDMVYEHSRRENCSEEIMQAFVAHDTHHRGYINAAELRNILTHFGEKLSDREVEAMFREAKVPASGQVKYVDFLKMMFMPLPDY